MNVTTLPKANQSAFRDACFVLSGLQSPGGVDIEIRSSSPAKLLGIKRIYATGTASVNVAPYVRGLLVPEPLCGRAAGTVLVANRAVPCYISAPGFTSSSVSLTGGTDDPVSNALMSASPKRLKIGAGEKDEMSVAVTSKIEPSLVFPHGGRQYIDNTTLASISASGVVTVVIDLDTAARSFASMSGLDASEMTGFTLRLKMAVTGGLATVDRNYIVDRTARTGRRLAWVNRYGAIDYYTFPVIAETRREGSRKRIETPMGYRTVATSAAKTETLLSESCDNATADWVSEIFSSPAVWKIEGTKFERVEVSAGSVENPRLQPSFISVTISSAVKPVSRKY